MRVHHTRPAGYFTILPNQTVRDHSLSFTARGLLAFLLSLPDGASEDVKTLAAKSREGRGAISRALDELEKAGYRVRTVVHDELGRLYTRVDVYDTPKDAKAQVAPVPAKPGTGEPGPGKPGTGEPGPGNAGRKPEQVEIEESLPPHKAQDGDEAGRVGGSTRAQIILASIARAESRLHLSASEAAELTPLVDQWLERGAKEATIATVLTAGLPARVHSALAIIRHRLTAKMPPIPAPTAPPSLRVECDDCGVPIPTTGLCRSCTDGTEPEVDGVFAAIGRAGAALVRASMRPTLAAS